MGQTASGAPGVPTGYQPSHFADKVLSSPARLKSEDGTWPEQKEFAASSSTSGYEFDKKLFGSSHLPEDLGLQNSVHHSFASERGPVDRFAPAHDPDPFDREPRRLPSFSPVTDRIPSYQTDVGNDYAPSKSMSGSRLAPEKRLESFASEQSYSSGMRYPPPPPMPGAGPYASSEIGSSYGGGQSNNTFLDDDDLLRPGGALSTGLSSYGGGAGGGDWADGTVIEVFSATTNRWYPALITKVQPQTDGREVLTVLFYVRDEAKQKSMYREDKHLTELGTHTFGELPPGFETRPSQSRPGQLVYLDATTGTKYASPQLAWRLHFERLQQQPAIGCQTVAAVPARGAAASPGLGRAESGPWEVAAAPSPMKALTLAELSRFGAEQGGPASMRHPDFSDCGNSMAAPGGGKVALPAFGDNFDSQAAYLGYVGTAGQAAGSESLTVEGPAAGYPILKASAPKREIRPTRNHNPALQVWQEDPFSEWRR
ncbi:unnamed protein product [Polarella glacialis]|uniref:Uncharacterized protein n=1 Tax=Polarella glacialis TaxID=89957 RepID=A0A813FD70_POLGL|nr:unnamed protein product [Polarella glacialis]